ncbi:cobyrinic acid a,c-diamide synthase [Actinopolyspora erythraea]|uniref:Hydrogenobyrinate a,c-diamide synthase n=1 Tax=Actinopolyspora erythraea TaxID=414996 RepID=A0A223RQL4_9ACTN|nr:cobyrinate a,c-diamide synthase [Actinopolyspora erythraea]ASU78169.1 cobyrinic acid a,c-diamide synthase [Actinopolyspora erythraea]
MSHSVAATSESRPRVVVAAPASGHGKTTVATGLLAALRRRFGRVAGFKVGPDYIDPGYHAVATGAPGRNLDPVLVGEGLVAPLFAHGAEGVDLSVVEGVMGLFDGRLGTADEVPPYGSTAHVAALLEAPVVLVVDARGQSQSVAALLHGFRAFQPGLRLGGVIFNRVGSARHERVLRDAARSVGVNVLGVLGRADELHVPSRHLGLVTAAEHGTQATDAVSAMADVVASGVDLDEVAALAASAPDLPAEPWSPEVSLGDPVLRGDRSPRIAMAGGPAFTFGYTEHVELLRAAGAEVTVVDPLRAERLPAGTSGLVLPGGFPEQYVAELSANEGLRRDISERVGEGLPVHAECAGLLYLARNLDGHPLCGVLDVEARMSPRLTLGYREAVAASDSVLFREGSRVAGHEFHRTVLTPGAGEKPAWYWRDGGVVTEGFVRGGLHASYLHTHPAASPDAVARFVRECAG